MSLLRFDRKNYFFPVEIACLMCGLDPVEVVELKKLDIDLDLIRNSMLNAYKYYLKKDLFYSTDEFYKKCLFPAVLKSGIESNEINLTEPKERLKKSAFFDRIKTENIFNDTDIIENISNFDVEVNYYDYYSNGGFEEELFLKTKFSRSEIRRWLNASGYFSEYKFSLIIVPEVATGTNEIFDENNEPEGLPNELDIANIAYRAVANEIDGDKSVTFKNKLISWIEKNYKNLSKEAIQRIATVANADKRSGRR